MVNKLKIIMSIASAMLMLTVVGIIVTDSEVEADGPVATYEWYGDGTETTFTISNEGDLLGFANLVNGTDGKTAVNFAGKTVTLGTSIDLTITEWVPIGTSSNNFSGTFDGGNNEISNLNITSDLIQHVGLFGYVSNATINDVAVEVDILIDNYQGTNALNIGAIAGYANASTFNNTDSSGSVVAKATKVDADSGSSVYAGGIIGYTGGVTNLTDCDSTVTLDCESQWTSPDFGANSKVFAGGMVGYFTAAAINDCTYTGKIIGKAVLNAEVGGIAGYGGDGSNKTEINGCTVIADISGESYRSYVGGIYGFLSNGNDDSLVSNCNVNVNDPDRKITSISSNNGYTGESRSIATVGGVFGQVGDNKITISDVSIGGILSAHNGASEKTDGVGIAAVVGLLGGTGHTISDIDAELVFESNDFNFLGISASIFEPTDGYTATNVNLKLDNLSLEREEDIFKISSGETLTVLGTLNNEGKIINDGTITVNGTLLNEGELKSNNTSFTISESGYLLDVGEITLSASENKIVVNGEYAGDNVDKVDVTSGKTIQYDELDVDNPVVSKPDSSIVAIKYSSPPTKPIEIELAGGMGVSIPVETIPSTANIIVSMKKFDMVSEVGGTTYDVEVLGIPSGTLLTVTLPATGSNSKVYFYLDGTYEEMNIISSTSDSVTFEVNHNSKFVVVSSSDPPTTLYKVTFPTGEGFSVRYNSVYITDKLPFNIFVEEGYELGNVWSSNGTIDYFGGGSYVLRDVTADSEVYINVTKTASGPSDNGTATVLIAIAAVAVAVLAILAYALINKGKI